MKNGVMLVALLTGLLLQQTEAHARGRFRQLFSRGGHVSSPCANSQCNTGGCATGQCSKPGMVCENGVCKIVVPFQDEVEKAAKDDPSYVEQLKEKISGKPFIPAPKTAESSKTDDKSVSVGPPPDEVSTQVALATDQTKVEKIETWSVEDYLLVETNKQRAMHGLRPLKLCKNLLQTAREHSWWMARNRTHRHGNLYKLHGSSENIAMSSADASDAIRMWMNSSGHRAAILNGGYARIGVAAYQGPDGNTYFTQQFGH